MPQTIPEGGKRFFLADLVDAPVCDSRGTVIGRLEDLTMTLGDRFPRLGQLIIKTHDGRRLLARRDQFAALAPDDLRLGTSVTELADAEHLPSSVLVKSIWDKQIVDTGDARVVRVNDLQLAEHKGELRLVGVDIGTRGLVRRLGWERWLCPLLERLRLPLANDLIAWDLVESLPTNFSQIKLTVTSQKIRDLHPADLADILDDLSPQEGLSLIHSLDTETAAETLAEAESETQVQIIEQLAPEKASDLLEEMEPDEAADILQDLDDDKAAEILAHMETEDATEVRELLRHDEETAGGLMSTGYVTIYEEFTVTDALAHLRVVAPDIEIIYYLYVVDDQERLKGVVTLRDVLVASQDTPVTKVMNTDLVTVTPDERQEEVANLISKYDLLALPVVDANGVMQGVVTVDDVIELLMDHLPRVWKRRAQTS